METANKRRMSETPGATTRRVAFSLTLRPAAPRPHADLHRHDFCCAGAVEYVLTVNELHKMCGRTYRPRVDFSLLVGALVGLLGLFLLVTILTHTEVF